VNLRTYSECTWERTRSVPGSVLRAYLGAIVKQAGSVSLGAIGSVLESMLGSVLEKVLGSLLGAYSVWTCERLDNVSRAYLGACNEVQLAVC